MNRAALAFKPRTGRAVLVMLAGDLHEPRVIERSEVRLLPPGEFAPYVRMHKAEGELFRDVLVKGVCACGFELTTLPDKTAIDAAAKRLGVTRARLDAELTALGKKAGPPWGKYQKEAAAAALVVLKEAKGKAGGACRPD